MVEIVSDQTEQQQTDEDVAAKFRLNLLADKLVQTTCTSIALQLPDSLLDWAPEVCMHLESLLAQRDPQTKRLVYALADT